jgi:Tfp pilus assembly protein PilN
MMITVNLRPGTKRGKSGPSLGGGLAWVQGLGTTVKDPLRLVAMVAWVGVLGFLGWSYLQTAGQLSELEPRVEDLRSQHQRFREFLVQKEKEEMVRDSILAQIRTIQQVDGDRYVWPHILDEVARALPPFTWLVDVGPAPATEPLQPTDSTMAPVPPPVEVQVTGRTVDIQGYTRLMRQLEDSPWLGNVTAVSANTVVEQGRAVTAFVLKATFTRPDRTQIRTVPVAESVVR